MTLRADDYVLLRDEILYMDGRHIFFGEGGEGTLLRADRALVDCVQRGEVRFDVLCQALSTLELGGDRGRFARSVKECVALPGTAFVVVHSLIDPQPAFVVCDFDDVDGPVNGRALTASLRRFGRVVHLGLKEQVNTRSPDSMWFERARRMQPNVTWFMFLQWARGYVRAATQSVNVLTGHRDAVVFGDLVASVPSVVVLDPYWPPQVRASDVLGDLAVRGDPIGHIRRLLYALRSCSQEEFVTINRNSGSFLAALEAFAIGHADVVGATSNRSLQHIHEVRDPADAVHVLCALKRTGPRYEPDNQAIGIIADLADGIRPLAPLLSKLVTSSGVRGSASRLLVFGCRGPAYEARVTEGVIETTPVDALPEDCGVAFICPELTRDLSAAFSWLKSRVPSQVILSDASKGLRDRLPSELVLTSASVERLGSTIEELLSEDSSLRTSVLSAQKRVAKEWEASGLIKTLYRRFQES